MNVRLDHNKTASRIRGECARWNKEKAFGFIKRDDGESDLFVHIDLIVDHQQLHPGERVEFQVVKDSKNGKICASRVERIKEAVDEIEIESVDKQLEDQSASSGSRVNDVIPKNEIREFDKETTKKINDVPRIRLNVPTIKMTVKGGKQRIERMIEELNSLGHHTITCHFVTKE